MNLDLTSRIKRPVSVFVFGLAFAFAGFALSLMIGPTTIPFKAAMDAVFHFTAAEDQLIVWDVRLPRTLATFIVGANLAMAGAIMQALTRNSLASPSVFGINAGASFVIVLCIVMFPNVNGWMLSGAGFAGGLLAALLIYSMSAVFRGGNMEVKMALIGIVIQALLSSLTQGLLIFNEDTTQSILFWLAGSVAGSQWSDLALLVPVSAVSFFAALLASRHLTILNLGEDIARSLGQRVYLLRILFAVLVVLFAGISVSTVGPIGFVGLITPHIVRYLAGNDYRLILPFCALLGGILLTFADIASRFISFPYETAVGIVTALIGGPYFIYLARRKGVRN